MKTSKLALVLAMTSLSAFVIGCSANANNTAEENIQPPAIIQQPSTPTPAPIEMEPSSTSTTETATATTTDGTAPTATVAPVVQKISIAQAIQTAESHSKGKAVEIELQRGQSSAIYNVETHEGTYEHHVQIDTVTGKVLSSYSERDLNIKPQVKIGLAQAIQIAEKAVAGEVVDANLDHEYITAHYEIKLRSQSGHPYELKVHANTGEILKSKVEYDDEDDDDDYEGKRHHHDKDKH